MKAFRFHRDPYIFLLPVYFVLHRYTEHFAAIAWTDALRILVIYEAVMIVLALALAILLKSARKGFLLAFFLMAFYFFYGAAHDSAKKLFGSSFITSYSFILPVVFLLFLLLVVYFQKANSSFTKLAKYLTVVLIIFILYDVVQLTIRQSADKKKMIQGAYECHQCVKPDIYLIISDGYAGRKQLSDSFHYDNSAFEDSLRHLGFHVVDSSFSNYSATVFSVSSLLNMDYLGKVKGTESHEMTNNLRFINYLSGQGYDIRNFSFFRIGGQFPLVSIRYFPTGPGLITDHTFFSRLDRDIRYTIAARLRIGSELERIERLRNEQISEERSRDGQVMKALLSESSISSSKPRFIYAHFTMPHGPFLFRKDGTPMSQDLSEKDQYLEYLQYTNDRILSGLNHIIRNSAKPPVILFMSDHGYRNDKQTVKDPLRFFNMNAVYLPQKKYQPYYKGLSNVNQFRILMNGLFQQDLPLLKDSTVF